jgi:hypothetical protein
MIRDSIKSRGMIRPTSAILVGVCPKQKGFSSWMWAKGSIVASNLKSCKRQHIHQGVQSFQDMAYWLVKKQKH